MKDQNFVLFETDLRHLDDAISLLKGKRKYTAAERLVEVRKLLVAHLADTASGGKR